MGQCGHKARVKRSAEGTRSMESSATVEGPQCCGGESAPGGEYYSSRIQSMIESRGEYETEVDAEIEASKVHWSEVQEVEGDKQCCLEANKAFFRSLQQQYNGGPEGDLSNFFVDRSDGGWELKEKIAEGAQGAIYRVQDRDTLVWKVFKLEGGLSLEALHKQWPPEMLESIYKSTKSLFHSTGSSALLKGVMLEDGRFAFVMERYWGDLRKMIDLRMIHNGNQASPFAIPFKRMHAIADGMRELHRIGIVHRDLKASNVLIFPHSWYKCQTDDYPEFNPLEDDMFSLHVGDFECSAGVNGTRFWRAPEILIALKNRCFEPNLCTEKSDVYSFGMTCYEILTGKIPLEEERSNNYDIVLGGKRPELPSDTYPWFRSMLDRCWHHEPSERPSFEEIAEKFVGIIDTSKAIISEGYGKVGIQNEKDLFEYLYRSKF